MSVGMRTYSRIKKMEVDANRLGFVLKNDIYGSNGDTFTLCANDEVLPSYRNGADLFKGDLDEVESFLVGIRWAREYDTLLGLKTTQRREKAEQRVRNQNLVKILSQDAQS